MSAPSKLDAVVVRVRQRRWARIGGGVAASACGAFAFVRAWTLDSPHDAKGMLWYRTTADASVLMLLLAALPAAALGATLGWFVAPSRAPAERALATALLGSRAWHASWWPILAATLVGPLLLAMPPSLGLQSGDPMSMAPTLVRFTTHLHAMMIATALVYAAVYDQHTAVARYPLVGVSLCGLVSVVFPGFGFLAIIVTPIVWVAGAAALLPAYLWTHRALGREVAWLKEALAETAPFP